MLTKKDIVKDFYDKDEFAILVNGFHDYATEAIDEAGLRFDLAFKLFFGEYNNRNMIQYLAKSLEIGTYQVRDLLYDELVQEYSI